MIDLCTGQISETLLSNAVSFGYGSLVRLLLRNGVGPNVKSESGQITLLMEVAYEHHEWIMQELMAHGAYYLTPEQKACLSRRPWGGKEIVCCIDRNEHLITERASLARKWLKQVEDVHGLPRCLTRLIGKFGDLTGEAIPA